MRRFREPGLVQGRIRRRECLLSLTASCVGTGVSSYSVRANAQSELVQVYADYVSAGDGRARSASLVAIKSGKIVAIRPTAARPLKPGQRRLWATPGFIAAPSNLGLVEVSLEQSTLDETPGALQDVAASHVRAQFSASDGYNPASSLIPVARLGGVTSVVAAPTGGVVSGVSAFADLVGDDLGNAVVNPQTSIHVNIDSSGERGGRPAAFALLREALEAARVFQRAGRRYDSARTRQLPFGVVALRNLTRVLRREIPVVMKASRASDIRGAVNLAKRYKLRLILEGAEEAWTLASELAAAEVPVVIQPLRNLPTQFASLRSRFDNAAILERAGVSVGFMTPGAHTVANLRQEAGNAVAHGMSWQAALSALTAVPASLFGAKNHGQLGAGKVANLVLWDGDPFELTTSAVAVFIRGKAIPLVSRQTALFERFK